MPTFRSMRKGKKCFFVVGLRLSDHKVLHNIASSLKVLFRFRSDFLSFSLAFRTANFCSLRNLIKQLFHSRLLDMRLVIANSALRASLPIFNVRSWNNCSIFRKGIKSLQFSFRDSHLSTQPNPVILSNGGSIPAVHFSS